MMLEFYKKQREGVRQEIMRLIGQRGKAGPESVGQYENKIAQQKKELDRIEKDIKAEEAKNPPSKTIYFFVIVTTQEKVKHNLGDCYKYLNHQRYHPTDKSLWIPFNRSSETIQVILKEIQEKYPIEVKYLDGELSDDDRIKLDDLIDKSIAIVDLLSLDEANKTTALKFDTKKSKLLLPLCRHLQNDIFDHADKIRSDFKTLSAYGKKKIHCMFFSDIASYDMFSRHITSILTTSFPIKNQSNTSNPVRNIMSMNNNFQ